MFRDGRPVLSRRELLTLGFSLMAGIGCNPETPVIPSQEPAARTPSPQAEIPTIRGVLAIASPGILVPTPGRSPVASPSPIPAFFTETSGTIPLSAELASTLGPEFFKWWDLQTTRMERLAMLDYGEKGVWGKVFSADGLKKHTRPGLDEPTDYYQPWFKLSEPVNYHYLVERLTSRGLERWFLHREVFRNIYNPEETRMTTTYGAERIGGQRFLTIINQPDIPKLVDLTARS